MKKAILVATIGALTLSVNAGDWGKAPVDKTPVEECVDLGGNISAGYHTDYIFRGVRWARDTVSADVNYTTDALPVPVTIGTSYFNGINGDGVLLGAFDMLHLYTDVAVGTFAGFDVSLGYTHYVFPEFRSGGGVAPFTTGLGYGEIGVDISRSLGFADLTYSNAYAMGGIANGWFHQLGAERSFGLTDSINLVLGGFSPSWWPVRGRRHEGGVHLLAAPDIDCRRSFPTCCNAQDVYKQAAAVAWTCRGLPSPARH